MPLYSPESTYWEMLPGYLYFLAWKFTWSPRLFPGVLGILEILFIGRWVGKRYGSTEGWAASALLAICPWHFFYSRIIGTCTGVILLFLISRSSVGTVSSRVTGLLYYATFRLVWLRDVIEGVIKRDRRRLIGCGLSLLVALLLVLISPSPLSAFFSRGNYNFLNVNLSVFRNYFTSLCFPFFPFPLSYRESNASFLADFVHSALASSVPGPVLGWGIAALSVWGLILLIKRAREELFFLLGIWFMLGFMGPSLSRFLIVLPILILAGALALGALSPRRQLAVLWGVFFFTFIPSVILWRNLGDNKAMENLFFSRHRERDQWIRTHLAYATPETVHLMAEDGFLAARYYAWETGTYSVYPALSPEELGNILHFRAEGKSKIFIMDREAPRRFEYPDPTSSARIASIREALRSKPYVYAVEHFSWGDVYTLDWPYEDTHQKLAGLIRD